MNERSIRIAQASMTDLARMKRFIVDSAVELGGDPELAAEVNIAAEEAITNILLHGYENKPGLLWITVKKKSTDLQIHIWDLAPTFDPTGFPRPDVHLPLESRPSGGLGIHMMRSFTDEIAYQKTTDGMNELIITKHNMIKLLPDV